MFPTRVMLKKAMKLKPQKVQASDYIGRGGAVRTVPLVRIPSEARIFPYGAADVKDETKALLRFPKGGMVVNDGGSEGWAIVGDAEGRKLAVETILGRHRITPSTPPPGPLPVAQQEAPMRSIDPETWKPVVYLAFAKPSATGEFIDYTARYGHLEEGDSNTLRHTLMSAYPPSEAAGNNVFRALNKMNLSHLIDIPAVALSSGQTRRARIAEALVAMPSMIVLEDPMAGLDPASRELVTDTLGDVNATQDEARIVLVLRDKGDETLNAEWITHVCEVNDGTVWVGTRNEWLDRKSRQPINHDDKRPEGNTSTNAAPIVRLQNVSVAYGEGERPIIKNVDWTIRPGDRWHLQGSNGSGKTTLLSVLLGHHPQSYSLPVSALNLFSQPRRTIATPVLRQLMGHLSPEIFAAFPRNMGLSAAQAIGSGYEGVFSRRNLAPEQKERILYLIGYFSEFLSSSKQHITDEAALKELANREFAHYTKPQQALLIFLRAVVARNPFLVLDEPTQGMDENIWKKCTEFLSEEWSQMRAEGKEQAVVCVSHYEDEVPWKHGKVIRLTDGVSEVIE